MLSFFPRGVLDEILILIESVSEDFPSYSLTHSCYILIVFSELVLSYYISVNTEIADKYLLSCLYL